MGEYFGYAVVSEDFNNDNFTDIAIAAPFHRHGASFENGVVYMYRNIDGNSFDPLSSTTLRSGNEISGRFRMSISKIGDINNDGFNGITISLFGFVLIKVI